MTTFIINESADCFLNKSLVYEMSEHSEKPDPNFQKGILIFYFAFYLTNSHIRQGKMKK